MLEVMKEAKSEDNATKTDILRLGKEIAEIKRDIRALDVKSESVKNQLIIWTFPSCLPWLD